MGYGWSVGVGWSAECGSVEWQSVGWWGGWLECRSARWSGRVRVLGGMAEWESMELDMFGFFNFFCALFGGILQEKNCYLIDSLFVGI